MAKRTHKNAAKPALTEEWFRRYQQGESSPSIAKKDSYDVRTVRKYIEQHQREMETKEAKASVLRNALEKHYDDLRSYADMLNAKFLDAGRVKPLSDEEFLEAALQQHLPRSPIWTYITKLPNLDAEKRELRQKLYGWIEKRTKKYSGLTRLVAEGHKELANNTIEALKFQADRWSEGTPGMNLKENLESDFLGEGQYNIHYGPCHIIDRLDQRSLQGATKMVKKALKYLESLIRKSEELSGLERTTGEIARVKRKFSEELAVIRLKRIVPGHCKYCPL